MRRLAKWSFSPVDERRAHAIGFCTNAVERMVGDEQTIAAIFAYQLFRLGISFPVWLEIATLEKGLKAQKRT